MTPEGRVKAKVKALLKERGVWYFMPANNGMGRSGIPDFICCHKGKLVAIETKAPGRRNDTTPLQKMQIEGINLAGGTAMVIDDATQLEDFFA